MAEPEKPNDGTAKEEVAAAANTTPVADEKTAAPEEEVKATEKPTWYRQWFLLNAEPYKPNAGGYTTLNFIPSIGTTLLGILCGQVLLRIDLSKWSKLGILITGAAICFGLGIASHEYVCPIVKRIWTPSWTLFSTGWVLLILAAHYYLIDVRGYRRWTFPFLVVGMNSIAMYFLVHVIDSYIVEALRIHLGRGIFDIFGRAFAPVTAGAATLGILWLMLWWMHRRKMFVRI